MSNIALEQHAEGIMEFRFERPPVNAFNLDLAREAEERMREIQQSSEVRGLMLSGAGECFSGGIDIKEVPTYGPDEQREMVGTIDRTIQTLYSLPIPTVAAIHGAALGGALCLTFACDFRIATAEPCRLGLPEVLVGVPYPAVPLKVLLTELPPVAARRLTLTGCNIDAEEARSLGVVDEVVPAVQLRERAMELVKHLAGLPGYKRVKDQVRADVVAAIKEIVDQENDPLLQRWL